VGGESRRGPWADGDGGSGDLPCPVWQADSADRRTRPTRTSRVLPVPASLASSSRLSRGLLYGLVYADTEKAGYCAVTGL
jgi:hypothetical protein